jgi:hypothetical protein
MAFQKKRRRGATSLKREPADGLQRWKTVWGPPLRWLGVLLVVAAVGYGVQIGSERLREPGAFPLRYIQTEGEWRNLVKADVHAVAEAYIGQNFFVANLDELNTALATNPWIEQPWRCGAGGRIPSKSNCANARLRLLGRAGDGGSPGSPVYAGGGASAWSLADAGRTGRP